MFVNERLGFFKVNPTYRPMFSDVYMATACSVIITVIIFLLKYSFECSAVCGCNMSVFECAVYHYESVRHTHPV